MAQANMQEQEQSRTNHEQRELALQQETSDGDYPLTGSRIVSSIRHTSTRGNNSAHAAMMLHAQRAHGNQAIQRLVQRAGVAASSDRGAGAEGDLVKRIEAKSGGGQRLPASVRSRLEEGLGADLSHVQVHTDTEADRLARSVGSLAFTSGNDIFFTQSTYDPHSSEGMKLLAHEATHTVQQASGPVSGTPSTGGVSISDPQDSFEQQAERAAENVIVGRPAELPQRPAPHGGSGSTGVSGQRQAVQRMGWEPPTAPNSWNPYLYLKENKAGGYDFGASLGGRMNGDDSFSSQVLDILSVNGHLGKWGDEKDTRYGVQLSGGIADFKDKEKEGAVSGFDAGIGTFGGELSGGTGGFSIGAGASLIGGALTFGRENTDDPVLRAGGGLGPGGALRGWWGKEGANNHPKIGFGADVGPVSLDSKTPDDGKTTESGNTPYDYPRLMKMPGLSDSVIDAGRGALDSLLDW